MARRLGLPAQIAIAIVAAVSAAVIAFFVFDREPTGRQQGKALVGGPFELVDQSGRTVTQNDLAGSYALIYFGYTFCPDVCPTSLQTMSAAIDLLGPAGDEVQPVFVTVDPARDTVEQMAAYAAHFHPRLLALTGSEAQVADAARAYRVYYQRVDDSAATEYLMDHTSLYYLMGLDGEYVAHFSHDATAEEMAARIRELTGDE